MNKSSKNQGKSRQRNPPSDDDEETDQDQDADVDSDSDVDTRSSNQKRRSRNDAVSGKKVLGHRKAIAQDPRAKTQRCLSEVDRRDYTGDQDDLAKEVRVS